MSTLQPWLKYWFYADARGIHSHGAVRVEYYAERISKAAPTANRSFVLRKPDRARQFYMPINAAGQVAAKMGMEHAIKTAQQKALRWSVSAGWVTAAQSLIFVQQAARAGLIGISLCQSDPMVVPFGGAEILLRH